MSTHAGPLPGVRGPVAVRPAGLIGLWRGFVERLDPLAVSVPAFTGAGQIMPKVETLPGFPLTVGAAIWVTCIEGNRDDLVIVALRGGVGTLVRVVGVGVVGAVGVVG